MPRIYTSNNTTTSTGDGNYYYPLTASTFWWEEQTPPVKWKKIEPKDRTLDEILFDDDETFERKKNEGGVIIDMPWPSNIEDATEVWTQWKTTTAGNAGDSVWVQPLTCSNGHWEHAE